MKHYTYRIIYMLIMVAIVVFCQWWFAVDFSADDISRAVVTILGIGGMEGGRLLLSRKQTE